MKWFKHMSNSLSDPFIEELLDEFKATGYIAWFGLIELISQDNGDNLTGKLSVKPSYLKRKLRTSPEKLRQVYEYCQINAKLSVRFEEKKWHFDFAKIQEIKDNHTANLQATEKRLALEKSREEKRKSRGEKEKKKKLTEKRYGEYGHVLLNEEKLSELQKIHGDRLSALIEILDEAIDAKGYTYKRFFSILKNGWPVREYEKRIKEAKSETPEEKVKREASKL